MNKVALIISTGVQDLKVVCTEERDGETRIILRGMDRDRRRELHERLLNDDPPWWRIVATEDELKQALPEQMRDLEIPFLKAGGSREKQQDKYIKAARQGNNLPFEADCFKGVVVKALAGEDGRYLFFPSKLHTVVAGLKQQNYDITAALVCYTDRKYNSNFDKEYKEEPIATGKLIAEWLADGNGLNPEEGADFEGHAFCYLNYLKDEVALEGKRVAEERQFSPYDQPLALSAIAHIDSAVKALADKHGDCTAVVSHTGGPGDVKAPLTASARLHFGGRVIEIHDNKYASFKPEYLSSLGYCVPPRNAALETRHQAALRLWEGDFAGAWAVASYIEKNDPEHPCDMWVEKVKQLANYMEGYINDTPFAETGLSAKDKEILWKAFQVEAAIQNNLGEPMAVRLLRVLGTYREAVEVCLIRLKLKEEGFQFDKKDHLNSEPSNYKKFFAERYGKYIIRPIVKKRRLIDELDYSDDIKGFFAFIDSDISKGAKSLRNYRNDVTHNQPPSGKEKVILDYGQDKGLWCYEANRQERKKLGCCFLEMPMTKTLLTTINPEINAGSLYRQAVGAVLDALHKPISKKCSPS